MRINGRGASVVALLAVVTVAPALRATSRNVADQSIQQFLAQEDTQHSYRATRRLEAENGSRSAWLEALTEYSPQGGFRYEVTAEGGSGYIRSKVLRAVLDGEREAIARGESGRASLDSANYEFQADGVDEQGLANILLSPRRRERALVAGRMFLQPDSGRLVRLQGRLAKSPSMWISSVEIVRLYDRIDGAVVPVALESNAKVRMLGPATLRMSYTYSHIDGHPIVPPRPQL